MPCPPGTPGARAAARLALRGALDAAGVRACRLRRVLYGAVSDEICFAQLLRRVRCGRVHGGRVGVTGVHRDGERSRRRDGACPEKHVLEARQATLVQLAAHATRAAPARLRAPRLLCPELDGTEVNVNELGVVAELGQHARDARPLALPRALHREHLLADW